MLGLHQTSGGKAAICSEKWLQISPPNLHNQSKLCSLSKEPVCEPPLPSSPQFIRECEARLVVDYMEDYLYPHMQDMIHQEKHSDLSNLYTLLNGIPKALQPAVRTFEEHVKNQGMVWGSKVKVQ